MAHLFLGCLLPVLIGGYVNARKRQSQLSIKHAQELATLRAEYESAIAELRAGKFEVR